MRERRRQALMLRRFLLSEGGDNPIGNEDYPATEDDEA